MNVMRNTIVAAGLVGTLLFGASAVEAAQAPDNLTGIAPNVLAAGSGHVALSGDPAIPAARGTEEVKVAGRYRRHRRRSRRRYRRGLAIGAGALILGAIIASEAAKADRRRGRRYNRRGYRARKRDCARDYRSFDWETETIITYGGDEILCPYLR